MINIDHHHRLIRNKAKLIHFGLIPLALVVPLLWIYWSYGICQESESVLMMRICGAFQLVPLLPALVGSYVFGLIFCELVVLGVKHYEEKHEVTVERPQLAHAVHGYRAIDDHHRRHVLFAAAQVVLVSVALVFWLLYERHHSTH